MSLLAGLAMAGATAYAGYKNYKAQKEANRQNKELALNAYSNAVRDAERAGLSPQVATGASNFGASGVQTAERNDFDPVGIARQIYEMQTAKQQARIAKHDADVIDDPNGQYAGITSDSAKGIVGQILTAFGAIKGHTPNEPIIPITASPHGDSGSWKELAEKVSSFTKRFGQFGSVHKDIIDPVVKDDVSPIEKEVVTLNPSASPSEMIDRIGQQSANEYGDGFVKYCIETARKSYHQRSGIWKDMTYDEAFSYMYAQGIPFDYKTYY